MQLRDLTGQKFERLTAVRRVENAPGSHQARWLFRCDCGKEIEVFGYNVAHGRQKSCGCYVDDHPSRLEHGKSGTKVFHAWRAMRQRCSNPKAREYPYYGGRGIRVCERWESFDNFLADMGEPPTPDATIDRENNDGNYEPGNCRWASRKRQTRNRRVTPQCEFRGMTQSLADWADQLGLPYKVVWHRYSKMKWRGEQLFSPLRKVSSGAARKGSSRVAQA